MSFPGFATEGSGAIQLHNPYSSQRKASTMDHEGKKAILEKMRNYPFHAIFERRCRKDSMNNLHTFHKNSLLPDGAQSKSMGVDIFTDDVPVDQLYKGKSHFSLNMNLFI